MEILTSLRIRDPSGGIRIIDAANPVNRPARRHTDWGIAALTATDEDERRMVESPLVAPANPPATLTETVLPLVTVPCECELRMPPPIRCPTNPPA